MKTIGSLLFMLALVAVGFAAAAYLLVACPDSAPAGWVRGLVCRIVGEEAAAPSNAAPGAPAADDTARFSESTSPHDRAERDVHVRSDDDAATWRGLFDENRYVGKLLDEHQFEGKVVMVYEFDVRVADSLRQLPRIQQLWDAFRSKPFVMLGVHRGGRSAEAEAAIAEAKLSFPVYEGVEFRRRPQNVKSCPFIYVVDRRGRVIYRGTDDREATEELVPALTDASLVQSHAAERPGRPRGARGARGAGERRKAEGLQGPRDHGRGHHRQLKRGGALDGAPLSGGELKQ